MKFTTRALAGAFLILIGTTAYASPRLTPQQCSDYPFTHTKGPVTHAQLMNELSELESVGYNPSAGDEDDYPTDIETAEHKLTAKYQTDCINTASTVASNTP